MIFGKRVEFRDDIATKIKIVYLRGAKYEGSNLSRRKEGG